MLLVGGITILILAVLSYAILTELKARDFKKELQHAIELNHDLKRGLDSTQAEQERIQRLLEAYEKAEAYGETSSIPSAPPQADPRRLRQEIQAKARLAAEKQQLQDSLQHVIQQKELTATERDSLQQNITALVTEIDQLRQEKTVLEDSILAMMETKPEPTPEPPPPVPTSRIEHRKQIKQIQNLQNTAETSLATNDSLNALIASIQAGKQLQHIPESTVNMTTRLNVLASLNRVVFGQDKRRQFPQGHRGRIWDVAFSPDGKHLATAATDSTVKLWGTDGTWRRTLAHPVAVYSVAFHPGGQYLASGSQDGSIRLWNWVTGAEDWVFRGHHGTVWDVVFSKDGQQLVSAGNDNTLRLWSLRSQEEVHVFRGHNGAVTQVALSPTQPFLISGSIDRTLKAWDIEDGTLMITLKEHIASVQDVVYHPSGNYFASAGDGMVINLWDREANLIHTLRGHEGSVRSIDFSLSENVIASAGADRSLKFWNMDGELLKSIDNFSEAELTRIRFNPHGDLLAITDAKGSIYIWSFDLDDMIKRACQLLHQRYPENAAGICQPTP